MIQVGEKTYTAIGVQNVLPLGDELYAVYLAVRKARKMEPLSLRFIRVADSDGSPLDEAPLLDWNALVLSLLCELGDELSLQIEPSVNSDSGARDGDYDVEVHRSENSGHGWVCCEATGDLHPNTIGLAIMRAWLARHWPKEES